MYGEQLHPEEIRNGRSITCCWTEKKKYYEYNKLKRFNLDVGMTLTELLKT